MRLANDYFMAKWPDPGEDIVTDKVRPSNIWTRATYYEGLMALYEIDPNSRHYDYAVDWGESHDWGMRSGNTTRNADDQCCGQTYIDLYLIDPQPECIENIKESIDFMAISTENDDWWWIDALHPNGFLGYVQSTGKQPSDGQPAGYNTVPNFEDYGLGAFLLAGSEICQLMQ